MFVWQSPERDGLPQSVDEAQLWGVGTKRGWQKKNDDSEGKRTSRGSSGVCGRLYDDIIYIYIGIVGTGDRYSAARRGEECGRRRGGKPENMRKWEGGGGSDSRLNMWTKLILWRVFRKRREAGMTRQMGKIERFVGNRRENDRDNLLARWCCHSNCVNKIVFRLTGIALY